MRFTGLQLANWRQFSQVDIEFHRNLTIITGANGAGKSTLLNILGQNLGQSRPYLGVPIQRDGQRSFFSSVFSIPNRIFEWIRPKTDPNWSDVGMLHYSNGTQSEIQVPTQGSQQYSLHIPKQQSVIGFHMPSHRNLPNYQLIQNMTFGGREPNAAFGTLISENYNAYKGGHTGYSVLFRLKELLANWAVFGEGNSTLGAKIDQKEAYEGFIDVLRSLLPPDLGFENIKIDAPDVVVETATGDFLIDSLSGGLLAVIEMAALIYTRSLVGDVPSGEFVVTLDEPENHLHPAMQRTILSSLVKAFPSVQFIVATHSPYVVASSRDSHVYALRYEDVMVADEPWGEPQRPISAETTLRRSRRVECIFLERGSLSVSPMEILREVLGVPVTFPLWVEDSLERIVNNYRDRPFNAETIADLRADVDAAGLSEVFPEAVLHLGRTN